MAVQPPSAVLLPVLRPLRLIVDGSVLRLGRLCDLTGAAAGSVPGCCDYLNWTHTRYASLA